jgi:hypothetical protein
MEQLLVAIIRISYWGLLPLDYCTYLTAKDQAYFPKPWKAMLYYPPSPVPRYDEWGQKYWWPAPRPAEAAKAEILKLKRRLAASG